MLINEMPGSVTQWKPLRLRICLFKLYSGSGIHSLFELNPNLFQRIYKFKTPYGILTMLLPPYWQQEGGELHGFFRFSYCHYYGWCNLPLHHQMAGR